MQLTASWFETRGVAALLTMRGWQRHPEGATNSRDVMGRGAARQKAIPTAKALELPRRSGFVFPRAKPLCN